jgi:hypothetical protein
LNNPFKYTDQTGEFWHIVIGALVGGVINLVVNWNNIDNFWEGLAIVGVGIAGGAITAATCGTDGGEGVLWAMATGAAISATNDIVRQTNDEIGLKDVDWGQVGISAGIGTVSGAASFGAGTWAANNLGGIVINGTNITSPVLTGTIKGTIGGAAGGYAGNFTSTLLLTGDVQLAHKMGLQGMAVGSVIGGSSGAANSYLDAKLNNLNPWTGKSNIKITSDDLGISFTMDRIMDGQTYPYRNDGSIFQNRENILPVQDAGYYKEYVHPTSGVSGPGAQRIIIGRGGEYYYSPDHYKTFIRFRH